MYVVLISLISASGVYRSRGRLRRSRWRQLVRHTNLRQHLNGCKCAVQPLDQLGATFEALGTWHSALLAQDFPLLLRTVPLDSEDTHSTIHELLTVPSSAHGIGIIQDSVLPVLSLWLILQERDILKSVGRVS